MAKMNQMYMNIIYGVFGLIVILIIILALKKSSNMESFSVGLAVKCDKNENWEDGVVDQDPAANGRTFYCDPDRPQHYLPTDTYCPRDFRAVCKRKFKKDNKRNN